MKNTKKEKERKFEKFFKPTPEAFWSEYEKDQTLPSQGFPCFCVILCKNVSEGQKGEDDPNNSLNNLIYIYPNNVYSDIKMRLVGAINSFVIFSIINLGCIPSSFSWSKSEIAIYSIKLKNDDNLIFALKLPKFFTDAGTSIALKRTIKLLQCTNLFLYSIIDENELGIVKDILKNNQSIITSFAFPNNKDISSPFHFLTQYSSFLAPNTPLAIATELDYLICKMSDHILGTSVHFMGYFILSSIPHSLSQFFEFYIKTTREEKDFEDGKFKVFKLWLLPEDLDFGNQSTSDITQEAKKPILVSLGIRVWKTISFAVLIRNDENNTAEINLLLENIKNLLSNGMPEFCDECESLSSNQADKGKSHLNSVLAFWPQSGIARHINCHQDSAIRVIKAYREMIKNDKLLEFVAFNGEKQISAMKLMNIEFFTEVEPKGSLKLQIEESYSRLKSFLPNLPSDIKNL